MSVSIKELVQQWLAVDVNNETRSQIIELEKQRDYATLSELLGSRIQFGTAGLRAKMEAGFNRLNDVTILQASQGLAEYVRKQNKSEELSVVVGHDHRHNSRRFAQITATVFRKLGFKVYYLEDKIVENDTTLVATPFVPFAVDYYHSHVGIMITASHNPAADNGYKVYWKNGCQIIPPNDINIANEILNCLKPWDGVWDDVNGFTKDKSIQYVKLEIAKNFFQTLKEKVIFDPKFENNKYNEELKFVYTPVHGVGSEFVTPIFEEIFKLKRDENYQIVRDQEFPDPDFRTVKFPNPEEKGALDLAIETAEKSNVNLIIANDPDADRFSAAVKHDGKFQQLTGNEIGFLFANYIIEKKVQTSMDLSQTYVLNSTVSSQMIKSMADHYHCHYQDTLTGFKWIGNKAIDLIEEGYDVPFGFEEAIGFMFPNVHDKDGLAATTVFLQLYYEYSIVQKKSLVEVLHEGFEKFGYFKQFNGYYKFDDLSITEKIFQKIRSSYANTTQPLKIGKFLVKYWRDLTLGYETGNLNNIPILPIDKSSHMITAIIKLDDKDDEFVRFSARGSGTEPKLKVYIEAKASNEKKAQDLAVQTWELLKDEWFKPKENDLLEVHP